jgi:hypothetical protein
MSKIFKIMIVGAVLTAQALLVACSSASSEVEAGVADAPLSVGPAREFTPPRNPHLSNSAWPITHRDSYAQHHGTASGVTGAGDVVVHEAYLGGVPLLLLDSEGWLIAVSFTARGDLRLSELDPATLLVRAQSTIADDGLFSGVYSFIDAADRVVLASGRRVLRYRRASGGFEVDGSRDLDPLLPNDDRLTAVSALYTGQIAFTSRRGCVGVMPSSELTAPGTAPIALECLPDERVNNGFSLDESGALFVVTDRSLNRFVFGAAGLQRDWSVPVPALTPVPRPGRVATGSGTTPSLLRADYVAIADDELSMNVRLYERRTGREVCRLPAFPNQAATTENSIAVLDDSMIVEQNLTGRRGLARIDLERSGRGCRRVWSSDVWAPNGVPTLSRDSGLVYAYARRNLDEWGLAGLDFRTGETRFFVTAGWGPSYDSLYSALIVGLDGRVFGGTALGVVSFHDSSDHSGPPARGSGNADSTLSP